MTLPEVPPADAPAPRLRQRLACFVYEGVLLFGVVMIAGLFYGIVTRQTQALVGTAGLRAFLFAVLGVYFVYFWSRSGQTLAMQTWHIRLVTRDGQRVRPLRALCRYLLAWLWFLPALATVWFSGLTGSGVTFGALSAGVLAYAGLVWLHPQRQFWHDAVCGTRLISWKLPPRKQRGTAAPPAPDPAAPVRPAPMTAPAPTPTPAPFSITVYCGARHGSDAAYTAAARALGQAIGERGWQLVYGGGKVGLMGEVADATLAAGGRVVGIIPETLKQMEVGHEGLHELHVVPTMHVRKQMMAERADVFIALPGGIGTLEELYEVWTWRQLKYHDQPIGLLNVAGYYDHLLRFMAHTVDQGFLSAPQNAVLEVGTEPVALLLRLAAQAGAATGTDDYSRV